MEFGKPQIASAIQNCYLGKPRIASVSTPTQPSLSESFRTDLNLSEQKFVFPNRSRLCSNAFLRVPFATLCKEKFTAACAYLRLSAVICGSVSCMILSGHDSVLGSCQIFRVFGCFLPRLKYFRTDPSRSKPNHDFFTHGFRSQSNSSEFQKNNSCCRFPVNSVNKR